jgi:hypothetical protein
MATRHPYKRPDQSKLAQSMSNHSVISASRFLGCSEPEVISYVKAGLLPAAMIDGKYWFATQHLVNLRFRLSNA